MTKTKAYLHSRGWPAALIAVASLALVSSAGAQPYGAPPPDSYAPAPQAPFAGASQRQDRLEELEAQVVAATAENERLQFELSRAEREVARLRGMVGELADTNNTIQETIANPPPPAPAVGQSADSSPGADARARATGTLGELSASQAPAAPTIDSATAFAAAHQLLLNNRPAEAEVAFEEFLAQHGESEQAPDARYWLAFTLLSRNDYARARAGFIDYMRRYPNSARAPEAQVRLGMALIGNGENNMGCAAFRDLPRNTTRAVRDIAAREARAASCPA